MRAHVHPGTRSKRPRVAVKPAVTQRLSASSATIVLLTVVLPTVVLLTVVLLIVILLVVKCYYEYVCSYVMFVRILSVWVAYNYAELPLTEVLPVTVDLYFCLCVCFLLLFSLLVLITLFAFVQVYTISYFL